MHAWFKLVYEYFHCLETEDSDELGDLEPIEKSHSFVIVDAIQGAVLSPKHQVEERKAKSSDEWRP